MSKFDVLRVTVLVQVPAEESISSSDDLWAIRAEEVVASTALRVKVQVQKISCQSTVKLGYNDHGYNKFVAVTN